MAFKVVEEKHEKVKDTNPNTYLKRAEDFIKREKYPQALEAINTALEYGKNNPKVIEECNKIKPLIDPDIILKDYESDIKEKKYKELKEKINKALKMSCNSYNTKKKCYQIEQIILKNEIKDSNEVIIEAENLINEGNLNLAYNKLKNNEIIKNTNSTEIKNKVKSLENKIRKNRESSYVLIDAAEKAVKSSNYEQAIKYANNAVNYYNEDTIEEKRQHIIDECKKGNRALNLMIESKNEFSSGNYYESIQKAELAKDICKSSKLLSEEYEKKYDSLMKKIYELPNYKIMKLADQLEKHEKNKLAYDLYEKTNLVEAQYKCGMILKKNDDIKKAKQKFMLAADMGNVDAIIELLNEERDPKLYNNMIFYYVEKFPNLSKKLNEKGIKFSIPDLKNECEEYIYNKKYNLAMNKINLALKISQDAPYIHNLGKYILDEIKKAQEVDAELHNQDSKAKKLILKANKSYNNGKYYEALKYTKETLEICKDKNLYDKYKNIYDLLLDRIFTLPLKKLLEIADTFYENNDLNMALSIYSVLDSPEARYKEALIYEKMGDIFKSKGIYAYLANHEYDDAKVSLIRLTFDSREKNQLIISNLEKKPALIDKFNREKIKLDTNEMIKECNQYIANKEYSYVYRIISIAKKYFGNSDDIIKACETIQCNMDNIRISDSEKIIGYANDFINEGELDKASKKLDLLFNEINTYANIKLKVNELNDKINKNKNLADKILNKAKELAYENKTDKAIKLANKAIEYNCSSENKKRVQEIYQLVNFIKKDNYAAQLIEESNNEFSNKHYYNSINLANEAVESCKDNEDLYIKYMSIYNDFMKKIYNLNDDELADIGNCFLKSGQILKAKNYYKISNSPEARYQEGILLFNENKIKEALDKFIEAGNNNHIKAIKSVIVITGTDGKYKNLNLANSNYKKLKKINKNEAKNLCYYIQTAYKIPKKDMSYIKHKRLIDFRKRVIKFVFILIAIMLIIVISGFKLGFIKGKCILINVGLDDCNNHLVINQKVNIKKRIKMKPTFAKKPEVKVISSNDSIVEPYNNYIYANKKGKCVISFYCNGKKIRQIPVVVSDYIVKSAKVYTNDDLNYVGDTCTVSISYDGEGNKKNCPIKITSSNEDVIDVNDRELTAKGTGECIVNVSVGNYKKELKYNISVKKDDSYIIEDSSERYLNVDDLEGLSEKELKYAINEIFARNGYVFKDKDLNEYFSNKSWYHKDYSFNEKYFNEYESYNIDFIKQYIDDNLSSDNDDNINLDN